MGAKDYIIQHKSIIDKYIADGMFSHHQGASLMVLLYTKMIITLIVLLTGDMSEFGIVELVLREDIFYQVSVIYSFG